jgi:signal transduction histidine kinase
MKPEEALKVLVIEDTLTFSQLMISLLLEKYGFQADLAQNYAEAKILLEADAGKYFAAIVDIDLPDAHKGEAIDLALSFHIPTLVFTGQQTDRYQEDFWSKGIADYISKQGTYGLEYVAWMTNRLFHNPNVKVMVVEDSISAQKITQYILELHCYDVILASSGEDALARLKQSPDIHICVMDCNMDGLSGMETAAKMRITHSRDELEIIGVSAQGGVSISSDFIKSGANDFLLKPFAAEELLCRVNHAAERQEAFVKLRNLNALKNQMLGTAAHDIRGPIASINTAAGLISDDKISEEQKKYLLDMIQSSSRDTLELLESLLDISVLESGIVTLKLEDIDVGQLVKERIQIYVGAADNKSIVINSDIEEGICLSLDRVKIKEVVDNLITNAIKFSPLHSCVEVGLRKVDHQLEFFVSDSGVGIAEEEMDKLFVAFSALSSTATAGEKQTGLGLAIVKNIVDAHGGNIFYQPSASGGSMFCVQLPA